MRRLIVTALIAVSVTLAVPPASAGGPTSVIITEPATGRATALYYTDSRYADLEALIEAGKTLEGEPPGPRGDAINVTWMVHDVQPWRTQQLFPDAEGDPLVVTYGTAMTGDENQVTWTRIIDRDALENLLDQIFRPGATQPVPAVESPAPEPAVVERTVTQTQTAWYSLSGWRWLVPGFVVGAAVALLARGRRREDMDPPLILTDVAPGDQFTAQR